MEIPTKESRRKKLSDPIKCLENKPTFECHPSVDAVMSELIKII